MSEERPWENTAEVPQRFQEVAAGNENAGPYQPSKVHQHADSFSEQEPNQMAANTESTQVAREKQPAAQTFSDPSAPLTPSEAKVTKEDVFEALKDVIDPELGINIVDLGLVYGAEIHPDGAVTLEMTLTSAACPLTDMLEEQTRWVLSSMATSVAINWVWMPPWGPDRITEEGREQLRALGFNV